MAKINGGGYTAITTIDVNNDPMVIVDADDTTEDPSGTTHTISIAQVVEAMSEETITNIKMSGNQSLGTSGLVPDSDHVHPEPYWIPSDNGLQAANFPPGQMGNTLITIAGNLYLLKVWVRQPFTATNLLVSCATAGIGASTTSFCGLWNSSGTLLTGSSDIGSAFLTTGTKTLAFTTAQSLTPSGTGGFVWAGFVFNLATTQPTLRGNTNPGTQGVAGINTNLSNALSAAAVNGTAVTSLANITPSSNNQGGNASSYWVGIT